MHAWRTFFVGITVAACSGEPFTATTDSGRGGVPTTSEAGVSGSQTVPSAMMEGTTRGGSTTTREQPHEGGSAGSVTEHFTGGVGGVGGVGGGEPTGGAAGASGAPACRS